MSTRRNTKLKRKYQKDEEDSSLTIKALTYTKIIAKNNNYDSETSKSFEESLKKITSKEKKVICCFGSLYSAGNILNKN